MGNVKTKKIIDLYRTLLDPMGYTVVLKQTEKKLSEKWEPEDKEIYMTKGDGGGKGKEIISSIELEKKIQGLKKQSESIKKVMEETRLSTIQFMDTQQPNDVTTALYTGAEGKTINTATVRVFSTKLDYVTKLIDYLTELKSKKIAEEMLATIKEEHAHILGMEVSKEMGGAQLQVTIE